MDSRLSSADDECGNKSSQSDHSPADDDHSEPLHDNKVSQSEQSQPIEGDNKSNSNGVTEMKDKGDEEEEEKKDKDDNNEAEEKDIESKKKEDADKIRKDSIKRKEGKTSKLRMFMKLFSMFFKGDKTDKGEKTNKNEKKDEQIANNEEVEKEKKIEKDEKIDKDEQTGKE